MAEWAEGMRLLSFPNNQDVFWVVVGWTILYGALISLRTDGSPDSIRAFDDSVWAYAIMFGWPPLYWVMSHVALSY